MTTKGQLVAALCCSLAIEAYPAPVVAAAPQAAAAPAALTAEQWREDLRFMAAEMERRHKNLYHTVTREQFAAAVADLDAKIPTLQRHEIIVGMMRIAAMVGDGHTRVDPRKDAKFQMPSLPLKLYLFDDGLYVRAAMPAHAELVGARIEAIGGVPVDEAIRRAAEISARDNEMGPKLVVPLYLNMPQMLHALKLSPTPHAAVLKLRKGKRSWTATVRAGAVDPIWPPDTDISLVTPEGWLDSRTTAALPMWLQEPLIYHRMIDMPGQKTLYVQLNMVTDMKEQSLAEFSESIGERVRATNPRAVIVDLRLNLGGNGALARPLASQLIKAEDADTRLFVLTARGTFSATQFILDDLSRLSDAVFVGEPASSKPSSFGDSYRITLPNSGITARASIRWWQSGQNNDPWTTVDVAAPLTFAAYSSGRDPALDAALNYRAKPSLDELLSGAASAGGPAAAVGAIEAYITDPVHRYGHIDTPVAQAAERLYAKHPEAALAVSKAAARAFPTSADPFVVLAFLADKAGETKVARDAARQTLKLEPNNRVARAILERLDAPKN